MAYKTISPIPVVEGGTGAITLTGVLTGNGTSAITANAVTQYGTVIAGVSNAVSSIAPSATSGIPYISQGAASNPTFGTAVVAGGGTGNTTFTAYSVICAGTTATGAFQNVSGVGTAGQVLTSAGAAALPLWQSSSGFPFVWSVITADQNAAVNNGYICNKAGLLTLTLPTTSIVGDIIEVTGMNTDLGWKIAQNANQQIHFGAFDTSSGVGGSLASTLTYDSVKIVCNVANLEWIVTSSIGNITVV